MSTAADLLDQLHCLTEQLLALDPTTLPADELHASTMRLEAERSRLAVAAATVTREFAVRRAWRADGTLKPELAIGRDAKRDHEAARRDIRRARWLERMPLTRQAVVDGRLSIDHVDLLVHHAAGARFELFLQHEALLVDQWPRCPSSTTPDGWCSTGRLRPTTNCGRRRERPGGVPRCTCPARESPAAGSSTAQLAPVDHEIVATELQRLTREIALEDRRGGVNARPHSGVPRRWCAWPPGPSTPPAPGPAAVPGDRRRRDRTPPVPARLRHRGAPRRSRRAPRRGGLEAFLFDGSEVVLTTSKQRTFRGALRRAVQVRDKRCQHRSVCPTPAVDADIDHRTPAARGGPTSQFNGAVECIPHNRHPELHGHPEPRPRCPSPCSTHCAVDCVGACSARSKTPPSSSRSNLAGEKSTAATRVRLPECPP